jgi:hypothetical protein
MDDYFNILRHMARVRSLVVPGVPIAHQVLGSTSRGSEFLRI